MQQLTDAQRQMLTEYRELLSVMNEGFNYLKSDFGEQFAPQIARVFNDLLAAFEQLNSSHQQMTSIFSEDSRLNELIEKFKEIVENFSECFTTESDIKRIEIVKNKVIPLFESWKNEMERFINPYITN